MIGKQRYSSYSVLAVCLSAISAQGVEFSLIPVNASEAHAIIGNEIRVAAGARVFLGMYVSGWDDDLSGLPRLSLAQGTLDASSFQSGDTGSLVVPSAVACLADGDCVADFGVGATCGRDVPDQCDVFIIDSALTATSPCGFEITACSSGNLGCGGAALGAPCLDIGAPQYLGTISLDLSLDASGTFTVALTPSVDDTYALDHTGTLIAGMTLVPALVTIGSVEACCLPTGGCQFSTAAECASVGGSLGATCLGDLNGDGVDEGCQADCDEDLVPDIDETDTAKKDCDLDGECNGDEITGCTGDPLCADCNANSIPDGCEVDCNENGVPDDCDITAGTSQDCNGNGKPDDCEFVDCNGNGTLDSCDIANMTSPDCQPDGIPDECQDGGGCCLDTDGNGIFESCIETTSSLCELAGGVGQGPCVPCPDQNVALILEPGGDVFVHVIGPPIDCLGQSGLASRQGCSPTGPFSDVWKSDADGAMCHNFGASGHAILAGFFNTGSDSFTSTVCLEGEPLGVEFGEADTVVTRTADPFDRCDLPSGGSSQVDIAVTQLSLKSVAPITVLYGGEDPELWNVTVDLSTIAAPAGSLTALKTHCNGGTYTSVLNVQPRFTFTKATEPNLGLVRVLDTGVEGVPYVTLDQQIPVAWVHDLNEGLNITGDPCTAFHPGVDDPDQTVECDCNGNSVRDDCDLESAQSADCNLNGRPDSCDITELASLDCDGDLVPDECQPDCNGNEVADTCDIIAGTSMDDNGNDVPDACEREALPPTADLVRKNRYVSFRPGGGVGGEALPVVQALRVTSPDFPGWSKWVGIPNANGIASLQCTPLYREWGFAKIHVGSHDIRPNVSYEVQGIGTSGDVADAVPYSNPATSVPTEVVFANVTGGPSANFADITFVVDTFKNIGGLPAILLSDIAPETPDRKANFADITLSVDAFKNVPYPYGDPVACP